MTLKELSKVVDKLLKLPELEQAQVVIRGNEHLTIVGVDAVYLREGLDSDQAVVLLATEPTR